MGGRNPDFRVVLLIVAACLLSRLIRLGVRRERPQMDLVGTGDCEVRRRTLRHKLRDEPINAWRTGSMGSVFYYNHAAVGEIMRRFGRCFRRSSRVECSRDQQCRYSRLDRRMEILRNRALRPFATSSLILAYLKVAQVSALGFASNCGFGESGYVFRADHGKAHAPVESLVNGISHQQNCLPIHRPIVLISAVDHGGERAESVEQWAQLCDKHAARKGYGLGCSGIAVLYLEMGGGLVEAVDDGRELFLQIGIGFVANIIGGKVTTMAGCVELRRVSLGAAGIMERATISISWMNQAQITV
jgi:hypothetical protein